MILMASVLALGGCKDSKPSPATTNFNVPGATLNGSIRSGVVAGTGRCLRVRNGPRCICEYNLITSILNTVTGCVTQGGPGRDSSGDNFIKNSMLGFPSVGCEYEFEPIDTIEVGSPPAEFTLSMQGRLFSGEQFDEDLSFQIQCFE